MVRLVLIVGVMAAMAGLAPADTVESAGGVVIEGKVLSRTDAEVVIEVQVGGRAVQRRLPMRMVRAITTDGKREEIAGGLPRTPREIDAMIARAGKTPPDWLESTKLNLPASLDLSWPAKAPGNWDNQRNVGQYLWDIVHPNPGRWREGVKLMHHLMDLHPNDAELRDRAMGTLGGMYHNLFQDYARAAYWWRQSRSHRNEVGLAECYWKLGSREMAMKAINDLRAYPLSTVKLLADMGQTDQALRIAGLFQQGNGADEACVAAGDACRLAGRYPQAMQFYRRVIDMPDDKNNKRSKDRARASLEAIQLFDLLDLKKVPDGTYASESLGYEAPVAVEVKVAGGRIESVRVTRHREKQFYASIEDTTTQIVKKQSVKNIDATSGATITSEAIINATAKALAGGMRGQQKQ